MIPALLKENPNWVCVQFKEEKGEIILNKNKKPIKVPVSAKTGYYAKSNDSNTWDCFNTCVEYSRKNAKIKGVGYMLSMNDNFVFIDIDEMEENTTEKEKFINSIDSYTELSQSGKGYHIIVEIEDKKMFEKEAKENNLIGYGTPIKNTLSSKNGGYEIYIEKRYFWLTGNIVGNKSEIKKISNQKLIEIFEFIESKRKSNNLTPQQNITPIYLDDYKVIELANNAKNGSKFASLYNESGQDGNSENDLAFISMIAFFTQDREQIKRIVLNSPRYRDKFVKNKNYIDRTITKSLLNLSATYNPNNTSKQQNSQQVCQQPVDKHINLDLKPVKWHPDYCFVKFENDDWKKETLRMSEFWKKYNKETAPEIEKITVLPVEQNVMCLLKHYNLEIKYNIIKMDYEVFENNKCIDVLENYKSHIENLCTIQDLKTTDKRLLSNLTLIGRKNKYNIWEDYLIKSHQYYLNNPDKEIFNKFADTLISNDDFKNKYLGKFLLQMIYVGCSKDSDMTQSDYILVLKGLQYAGKTTWLQNLLPQELKDNYFLAGRMLDLNNKDSIMETVSNILVEMGEIASTFKKSDQEAIKNFITNSRDKFRIPYAAAAVTVKRRVCLCATTNDNEYLRDLTGTRRFLTIDCKGFDWEKSNRIDINMLWGYMYSLYLKGISYKFDAEGIKLINKVNEQYLNKPEKILIIEEVWDLFPHDDDGEWLTAGEIFEKLPNQVLLNKFTIGRELKKTNIRFKRDTHKKMDVFFVERKNKNDKNAPF